MRRIHQSVKRSWAYVLPELEANGAVFEVHRLGQEVDPDRRLHHGFTAGEQIAAARIIRSDFADRFQ
jgi:hypothetical protein